MKIHLFGNTCNNHYFIAKALRSIGVDAHLFYNCDLDKQTFPENHDPEIALNRPNWIHPYSNADIGNHPWIRLPGKFKEQIYDCDLIQAEDIGLVWAMQSGKPYVWYPYGYDIHFYAFHTYWVNHWSELNPELFYIPVLYRKAIAACSAFVTGLWDRDLAPSYRLIKELIGPERFLPSIFLGIDTDRFKPAETPSIKSLLKENDIDSKVRHFTIFHPTRIMFSEDSYCKKGNDKLLQACGKLKTVYQDFSLILVRKGNSDEKAAEKLIEELGIAANVIWIPSLPRHKMADWYRAADLTVDEFHSGAFGSISVETMSCGTAQMTYLEKENEDPTFWTPNSVFKSPPPIINTKSVDQIFSGLLYFIHRPDELLELGRQSRQWILENMSGQVIAEKWVSLYEGILSGTKGRIINESERRNTNLTRNVDQNHTVELLKYTEKILVSGTPQDKLAALIATLDVLPDNLSILGATIKLYCNKTSNFAFDLADAGERVFNDSYFTNLKSELRAALPQTQNYIGILDQQ